MTNAGMEPRNMTYQALIDHLVTLEDTETTSSPNKEGASGVNAKHVKFKGVKLWETQTLIQE